MRARLATAVRRLLHVQDTSHRTALAFALGIWIAFFPVLGIHTAMALGIAFAFRLNRLAILTGAYINNPWTLAPLYTAGTLVGCLVLAVPTDGMAAVDWSLKGRAFYDALLVSLKPYLWPFVVGNTLLGVVGGAVGYYGLRSFLDRRRRMPAAPPVASSAVAK